jgi:hypothetical protein
MAQRGRFKLSIVAMSAVATLVLATPASAQMSPRSGQFTGGHDGHSNGHSDRHHGGGFSGHRDHHDHFAYFDGDSYGDYGFDNSSWHSDSYNDWWHDQPWRAYPRWLTSGTRQVCWYAGDTLVCPSESRRSE